MSHISMMSGAGAALHRGRDARLQVWPADVVRGDGDVVLARPVLGDLGEERLAFRHEIGRGQGVHGPLLNVDRRVRRGVGVTGRGQHAAEGSSRNTQRRGATHHAAAREAHLHRLIDQLIGTGIGHIVLLIESRSRSGQLTGRERKPMRPGIFVRAETSD